MTDNEIRTAILKIAGHPDTETVKGKVRERIYAEEADSGICARFPSPVPTAKKRRMRFVLLIAAALLLTVGSIAGAPDLFARMRMVVPAEEVAEDEHRDIFRMNIEEWNDCLTLSDEVMETLEALEPWEENRSMEELAEQGAILAFDRWEAAVDWLDCGMLNSSLPEQEPVYLWYNDGSHDNIRSVCLWVWGSSEGTVDVGAYIPLNDEAWDIYNGGYGINPDSESPDGYGTPEEKHFTSALGDEVLLVSVPRELADTELVYSVAHFIHEGIIYRVDCYGTSREKAEDVVTAVMESFRP